MADGGVPIVLSPEPFARTTTYVESPAGCTVRTMLASAVSNAHLKLDDLPRTNVYVDGARIDRDEALSLVLVEGQIVNVVVEPLGGGGGGKKDVGQILLTIAVIAVSMWVGGPAGPLQAWPMLARQVAAAAILTAGQMAIAAIFKPESNISKANDRYALSSASNQYRPWASMPMALGEVVVAPDLAVKTFTQAQGEDQWIYGILGLHYGPCTAEDLKIGDTLVSSMGAGDVRVAYHLTPGPRTFSIVANDTDQLDLQEELAATVSGSTAVIRAASAEGERFEFDFFMPQGLYFAKDDGRKIGASLTVTIRYRPIDQNGVPTGSGAWANGLTIPLSSASSDPWRIMRSISLPLGRYEFEVKRSKLEDDNAKRKTDIGWTAIRAIAFRKPVIDETLSLIEFAVRASALNQGNLAPFTCRITPICETWTGTQWGAPVPTSNPAAITRWLMTGPAPAVALTKPQADVGLRTWAALCDQYNWKSHIYLTEDRKQDAVMQLLGMNGRASLFWDGTQLVSAPWVEKPAPRQLFAGSNLKDHRWEIVYPDPVHALRVEFQNIDQGGEADEVYVYADGYGETADPSNNILPATLVEALRLEGQQTIERAYRDGRWSLGARMHQRRVDSWSTDIEHIVCRYGDRVRLAWDRVGTANATVRNRLWSGGLVSGLRLSQPVRMEPGRVYALDLRLPDQVITGVPIVNPATTAAAVTRSVMFADLRAANVTPRGGDLVAFGEPERISEDVEIIGITPGSDLTANMVGIRYVAPLLMAGEAGPIPSLQSRLTRDRAMDPPMPTLLGWQANEEGVRIGFSMPPWRGSPITGFTLRWRQTPAAGQSSAWVPLPDLPANAMTAVTPPLRELPAEGTNVTSAQVQIVAVTADGRASTPLQVTVQEAAIQQPPAGDWSVSALPAAPDGARQSGLLAVGLVGGINPRRVTVEYGAGNAGPWNSAFDGPPVNGVVRAPIVGMAPGSQVWLAITYWTAQAAAPSLRKVLGPYTAPVLDPGPNAPTILQQRADIDALADQQASETIIRQEQIDTLTARSNQAANLIDNPSGAADPAGSSAIRSWVKEGGPNVQLINDQEVGRIFVVGNYMASQIYPASPGQKHSLGYNASPVGGGHVRLQYITPSGAVEGVRVDNTLNEKGERRRSSAPSVAPAGTTGFRLLAVPPSGGALPVWAIKVNFGDVATDFTDDYSANVLQADTSITKTLVLDLESQNELARLSLVAAASSGVPARIGLTSSTLGSAIAFDAPFIYWGANTVFVDETDILVTTLGDKVRVMAFGAPFGAGGNLLEWWGPASIPVGSMTTANGLNGRMTTAPGVFDNVTSAIFAGVANKSVVGGSREGSGPVETEAVTVAVSGASGPVTHAWSQVGGDDTFTINSPSSATTTFTATVLTVAQIKRATFVDRVTDTNTGRVSVVTVGAGVFREPDGGG